METIGKIPNLFWESDVAELRRERLSLSGKSSAVGTGLRLGVATLQISTKQPPEVASSTSPVASRPKRPSLSSIRMPRSTSA